jgi:lipid-A-disaccharide synthase
MDILLLIQCNRLNLKPNHQTLTMKYYIIAGEASGDLHGANLVKALKQSDTSADIRCWGGELMEKEGATLVKHYRETAYMGLFEVIAHARTIAKNFQFCYSDILEFKPDVLILIDYPGFNLRVARFAKERGIKVFYYISPKVWVWNEKRVKVIKKFVDKMFVIFPFEKGFYARHNYDVDYVGNPLFDAIENKLKTIPPKEEFYKAHNLPEKPLIALLPGSRKQEISRLLPVMLSVAKQFSEYQFVVAGTTALPESMYAKHIQNGNVKLIFNQTYEILKYSNAAIVASGTATLETALFNVPQVVCYKINKATYTLGKPFFPIKFFSLVNIIMDEEVVKELLQFNLEKDITLELRQILNSSDYREKMLRKYNELREKCGGPGASKKAADLIVNYLKS